jgi:hypothetical protein
VLTLVRVLKFLDQLKEEAAANAADTASTLKPMAAARNRAVRASHIRDISRVHITLKVVLETASRVRDVRSR